MNSRFRSLVFITLILIKFPIPAQDIYITVTGEYQDARISIDSLLFENLTDQSAFILKDMPEQDEYFINLSTQKLESPIGITASVQNEIFKVLKCIPGEMIIAFRNPGSTKTSVEVFNMKGQKLYFTTLMNISGYGSIKVLLGGKGMFFVKLRSSSETRIFKAAGSGGQKYFQVNLHEGIYPDWNKKGASLSLESDFNIHIGDDVKVTAYKEDLYADPLILQVTDNNLVEFIFSDSKSFLKINDTEYDLSDGLYGFYGNFENKGIYNHSLYLLSSGHNMNWETLETSGSGAIVNFELFNTGELIENGSYPFSTPEEMNTEQVCDEVDRNADGIINEDDCYYKLPDGKFYISSRISVYDANVNIYDLTGLKFHSGNLIITRDEDLFRLEFECMGENGDIISGFYSGTFHFYDFSESGKRKNRYEF